MMSFQLYLFRNGLQCQVTGGGQRGQCSMEDLKEEWLNVTGK